MLRALVQGGGGAGFTLSGLSSTFLNGEGAFVIPPYPSGAGSGTVTSVALAPPPIEFFVSGSPVTGAGTLGFDWLAPTVVAHGGTGMGSFAPNSVIRAGLGSSAKFQSTPLSGLSSTFLDGNGTFSVPAVPAGGGTVTSVALSAPVVEFIVTGSPVSSSGTLGFDWVAPTVVAHGGTGMGSFLAGSLIQAGLGSSAKFRSIALTTLSSDVLRGDGRFGPDPSLPILPNLTSTYYDGQGNFTAPTGRVLTNADLPTPISNKTFTFDTFVNPTVSGQVLADAATILWNMNSGSTAQVTPGASRMLGTVANIPANGTGILKIIQGGTGFTMSFVQQFVFAGNRTLPTLSSCPGQVDILSVYSDGTNLHASALVNFR